MTTEDIYLGITLYYFTTIGFAMVALHFSKPSIFMSASILQIINAVLIHTLHSRGYQHEIANSVGGALLTAILCFLAACLYLDAELDEFIKYLEKKKREGK